MIKDKNNWQVKSLGEVAELIPTLLLAREGFIDIGNLTFFYADSKTNEKFYNENKSLSLCKRETTE